MQNNLRHELILKQILRLIFQENSFSNRLGFKGGTCLYFFHDLSRFSVDLDFDLLSDDDEFSIQKMTDLLNRYAKVLDQHAKKHTYFWLLSYESGMQKIKIEINRRQFSPNKYQPLDFYGITIPAMTPKCMMAHKLCAITDRAVLQNRDLYDSYFMMMKNWEPEEKIIKMRTCLSLTEYYQYLIGFITKEVSQAKILDGLGQLLSDQQRSWVKENLKKELIAQLRMRVDSCGCPSND